VRWAAPVIRAGGQADATEDSGNPGEKKRGWAGWRTPGPVLQGLIAFAIYLAVFILGFGQALLPHLNLPKVGQVEVDPQFYIWALRWWPYALTHGLNPLYSTQIGAPGGFNLAWATTTPTVALLMWPITATIGPIAAFNVTLLLAPPASAWAAFVLARRLTGQFWPALLAGPVYGFCVYELDHDVSGQLNLTVTVMLPLIAYLAVLWWEGTLKRTGFVIWMAVALATEFYTFVEAFTELTILSVVALVLGFAVAGRAVRPKVARLAVLTAIAYVGAAVLAAPYLYYALRNIQNVTRQLPTFSTDFASLILPRSDRLLGMKWLAPSAGHDLNSSSYVGIPLLLLLLGLAVFSWSNRLVRLLVLFFVVDIALAVGPNLYIDGKKVVHLPWGFIWSLPILKSAEPMRFIDFGYLVLSVALALWLAQLTKSKLVRAARWGLGMLALAAIFANLPTFAEVVNPPTPKPTNWKEAIPTAQLPDQLPTFFTEGLYKQYITPGETVVILSHRGNAGMEFQAYTDFYFKLAGGFINASLTKADALPTPVENLSHLPGAVGAQRIADFKAYVKSAHIGALIVERAWSEHWMYVFGPLGMKATTVGGVTVFQVTSG
jgi:hypothetical protein